MNDALFDRMTGEYASSVDDLLDRCLESYGKLEEAMNYTLFSGGKRVRPVLSLAVCDMLCGKPERALPYAAAVELIHTYSLIHDDLPCMDDDDMRRGRPSNHKVFGEGQAVLAGDGLLTFAFEYMLKKGLEFNCPAYYNAVHEIARRAGVCGMVAGQARDLEAENGAAVDEAELRYIHTHKTADMLTAAVLAGAYSADADEASLDALEKYSEKMGLLFQITDDILDYEGDQSLVGKTIGKDAESQKLTYITLYGVEKAREIAKMTAKDAEKILSLAFDNDTEYLSTTVRLMLERKY